VATDGGSISDTFATGNVTSLGGAGVSMGGLVGLCDLGCSVSNSYASGNVTGGDNEVGGLLGAIESGSSVSNSFSLGRVTASPGPEIGIFFGTTNLDVIVFTDTFFFDVLGDSASTCGGDPASPAGCSSETEAYFQGPNSAANDGAGEIYEMWDFIDDWLEVDGGLPVLRDM